MSLVAASRGEATVARMPQAHYRVLVITTGGRPGVTQLTITNKLL